MSDKVFTRYTLYLP